MIILLDLNYTLVANSREKHKPFALQIQHEIYREWLASLVAPYHTIMMTARPEKHKQATLDSLYFKTGWIPQEAHFNRYFKPPHIAKRIMLQELVFPAHGENGKQYLAIESNPRTQAMYAEYGIPSIKVCENEEWKTLPTP
ncbi:MAG: hypothetical protein CMM93_03780 [Rickettsiales bacterium]|nr:hypothetical protein [Rickettsiales bacterium]|tara:strand:+ start:4709 stop:5131 length:423 start_codon:yes stop_codon:yes gene_type:complete